MTKVLRVIDFIYVDKDSKLMGWCEASTDMFNSTIEYINTTNNFDSFNLNTILKTTSEYKKLPKAKSAQNIIAVACQTWKSYIELDKLWNNQSNYEAKLIASGKKVNVRYRKISGKPNKPSNSSKLKPVIFDNSCSSIKDGYLVISKKDKIKIPDNISISDFQQVRIKHITGRKFKIEFVYKVEINNMNLDKNRFLSIDPGVSTVLTMIDSDGKAFLHNTNCVKYLKRYNHSINKKILKIKKKHVKIRKTKKYHASRRNNRLNDELHKMSRRVIDYCIQNNIGSIVVGYNKGWKSHSSLPKNVNKLFCAIGHSKFISLLSSKAELVNITVYTQNESYTSKCDFLADEKVGNKTSYLGKRLNRGLFSSSTKKLINADINGACNILKKLVDSQGMNTSIYSNLRVAGSLYLPDRDFDKKTIKIKRLNRKIVI